MCTYYLNTYGNDNFIKWLALKFEIQKVSNVSKIAIIFVFL